MSALFFGQTTDNQISEQTVYNYIQQNLDISPSLKSLTVLCARLQFTTAPNTRRRVEPSLFLAFLTILNTDSRLGLQEKTAIFQKISHYCQPEHPPLLWLFSTVYEFLSVPAFDQNQLNKLTSLMDTRRQNQVDTMNVLQKIGISVGVPIPGAPAPTVETLVRDIPVGQISQGLEDFILGRSSASSAKDAAMQAARANSAIPQQRPNSPAGPQLDPAWLPIITSKVDSIDASEWQRTMTSACQRLKQLGQNVNNKC
jgi:hypothetical protein